MSYWNEIERQETSQWEIAQKQAVIADKARAEAQAKAHKIHEDREQRYKDLPWWRKLSVDGRIFLLLFYFFYLIPVATIYSANKYTSNAILGGSTDFFLLLCPGINILVLIGMMFFSENPFESILITFSLIYAVLGIVILLSTKPIQKQDL
ncbi:hypothetical protein [Hydrogenophaga sp.]|uniref:hypothetical protein n=1 Tax=Hydrogenophaga sp. TaxID=1904254 RepID=UPI002FC91D88